jgi:hypothetical protein
VTQARGSIFDHLSPYLAMGIAQRELTLDQLAGGYEPPGDIGVKRAQQRGGTATDRVVEVLKSMRAAHGR